MASQLFCLALLAVSAVSAFGHDLTTRQQYVPLQNHGVYNQQAGSSVHGQIHNILQNMRYSPALVQQLIPQQGVSSGIEGQVNSPLRQLWWNRQQIWGNSEGLVNSYPEIMDICQRINMPVQGLLHQTIGVNELRKINQMLNILGNTEGLFHSYPEIVEFCQKVNMQVQGLVQQTLGVTEIKDANQRLNFLANTEGLIRSYSEIVDICQRINVPVQGLAHQTIRVNELREINHRLNVLGNSEGLFRSHSEIMGVCQKINMLVQGLVHQTLGVNEVGDVNQRLNIWGNTDVPIHSEVMNVCQRISMPLQGLVHQTIGVNELRVINQRLNILGNTEGLFRSYPEIVGVCQRINLLVQGLVHPTTGLTDVNQWWNLPVQSQHLLRPTLEVSELAVPLTQTNIDGALRYNNVVAPHYQSLFQYQPVSQVYPARQNILSLWGLRPTRFVNQVTVDPTQQVMQQHVPTYHINNDAINVERNLVY